jgi:hypothetical protein
MNITYFYAMLSDALGGPRIESVYRPQPYPIGMGSVETEWTHRSFGFVADVHGPPTGYGHINIVDPPTTPFTALVQQGEAPISSAYLVLDAASAEGPAVQSIGLSVEDDASTESILLRVCVHHPRTLGS